MSRLRQTGKSLWENVLSRISVTWLVTALGSLAILLSVSAGFRAGMAEGREAVVVDTMRDRVRRATLIRAFSDPDMLKGVTTKETGLFRLWPEITVSARTNSRAVPPIWQINRQDWSRNPDVTGLIAIVIDDLGVDRRRTQQVVDLPAPLTLAWLTYADDLAAQVARGQAAGHETLAHVPMEPLGPADPGPGALYVTSNLDALQIGLVEHLAKVPGAIGFNNHMGSRLTADPAAMLALSETAGRWGWLVLDSLTTARSQFAASARQQNVTALVRDVFIDHDRSFEGVESALRQIELIARDQGSAIAIGHPYDETITSLTAWLPSLQAKGLQLVPLSALAGRENDSLPAQAARDPYPGSATR